MRPKKWLLVAPIALVACGSGRNYDNPPEVAPITSSVSTIAPTTAPTTTVFVPTTAATTVPPPTAAPPPATYPPTAPPPTAPPTPRPTAPPTVPTTPVATTGEVYTVVGGDTIYGIARRLGVSMDALVGANGLNTNSLITPGQTLRVPQGGSVPGTNTPTAPPATNAPATNPPATNPPATNPPAPEGPARPTSPQGEPTTTFAAPPGEVRAADASASCQSPDSAEANGTPIVFAPSNVQDHNPGTGWRCDTPANGQTLTLTLGSPTRLTSVGIVGGYVKVDPLTLVDRFPQNHRVRGVRVTFSDGSSVEQELDDSRSMQSIAVDVTTSSVEIAILSTYPSSGPDPKQTFVVGEVSLIGG